LEQVAKLIVAVSLIVTYSYASELFFAWYRGEPAERSQSLFRAAGAYAPLVWLAIVTAAHVVFNLDTDQNPATGFPGVDAAHNDAALLGADYQVVLGSNSEGGTAKVLRWDAASGSFLLVATEPVSAGLAGYDGTVPLAV